MGSCCLCCCTTEAPSQVSCCLHPAQPSPPQTAVGCQFRYQCCPHLFTLFQTKVFGSTQSDLSPPWGGDPPWFGGTKSSRRAADGLGSWLPTLVPGRPNTTFVVSLPLSLRGPPKPMRPPISPPHLHRRTASISSTKAKGSGGVGWRLGLGLCVVEYRHPVFGQGKARMEFPVAAGRFRGIPQMFPSYFCKGQ